MRRKKAYKIFRVIDGELYSAFETGESCLHYKLGKRKRDPKPNEHCRGLMILLTKSNALSFLKACYPENPSYGFALCAVKPGGGIGHKYFGGKGWYGEAEVNELIPLEMVREKNYEKRR